MEIVEALAGLPGLRVTEVAGRVSVYVPPIDDTVRIDAAEVRRHRRIWAPNGDPAIEFVLGDDHGVWPLIITPGDVVFQPVDTRAVLDSAMKHRITDAPDLVAYTEMERTAEDVALRCEQPGSLEMYSVGATFLLVRCFVAAATLAGLRPVRTVAWWQRGWTAIGGDVPLPPFRADPMWDELAAEASQLTVTATPTAADNPADVTIADFDGLALTAVGLDEEFVSCWRASVPITPARFAETLLDRVDKAHADVALYPDGGGNVDVVVGEGDAVALLQFSWSTKEDLHIDEVRIPEPYAHTGLFQRL